MFSQVSPEHRAPGTTISLRLRLQAKPEAEDADVDRVDLEATPDAATDTAPASPSAPPSLGAEVRSFGKA